MVHLRAATSSSTWRRSSTSATALPKGICFVSIVFFLLAARAARRKKTMETKQMPFGSAVADVLERRQVEEDVAARKWTISDVEWFETRLQREDIEQADTFYRERARMMAEAFKRSHKRGDFLLPEEMTRAQFAEHVSS